jgi:L-iditol 2-dehydrogenase
MIGITAAQWAKKLGANSVTIIGRNESKRSIVEKCDLEYKVSSDKETVGQYDVVLEAVGTPQAVDLSIHAATPGGTVVFMGNPSGDIELVQNTYWRILRKQLKIVGTWNSSYDGTNPSDWTEAVEALAKNEVNVEPLISHYFNQEELMDGLNLMKDNKEPYCKVMTLWNDK